MKIPTEPTDVMAEVLTEESLRPDFADPAPLAQPRSSDVRPDASGSSLRPATAFLRSLAGQRDAALRPRMVALAAAQPGFAQVLEEVCVRVEAADADARDALFVVVDWLAEEEPRPEFVPAKAKRPEDLRSAGGARTASSDFPPLELTRRSQLVHTARENRLPALLRFLGDSMGEVPQKAGKTGVVLADDRHRDARVLTDRSGRTLTLGERKALARRPTRDSIEKLLLDPHPDVVTRLLGNPRTTEADVLRLVAKRPGDTAILTCVARAPRWVHSARIRLALCMHPKLPNVFAVPLVALLLRQELRLVATSPSVSAAVRLACFDKLSRRPPLAEKPDDGTRH